MKYGFCSVAIRSSIDGMVHRPLFIRPAGLMKRERWAIPPKEVKRYKRVLGTLFPRPYRPWQLLCVTQWSLSSQLLQNGWGGYFLSAKRLERLLSLCKTVVAVILHQQVNLHTPCKFTWQPMGGGSNHGRRFQSWEAVSFCYFMGGGSEGTKIMFGGCKIMGERSLMGGGSNSWLAVSPTLSLCLQC